MEVRVLQRTPSLVPPQLSTREATPVLSPEPDPPHRLNSHRPRCPEASDLLGSPGGSGTSVPLTLPTVSAVPEVAHLPAVALPGWSGSALPAKPGDQRRLGAATSTTPGTKEGTQKPWSGAEDWGALSPDVAPSPSSPSRRDTDSRPGQHPVWETDRRLFSFLGLPRSLPDLVHQDPAAGFLLPPRKTGGAVARKWVEVTKAPWHLLIQHAHFKNKTIF